MQDKVKIIIENRRARHDYHILDTIEAGIALTGTEVKSIRRGEINIKEAYATVADGEVWIYSMHIAPYEEGNRYNVDPDRKRKLLLHRHEINRVQAKIQQQGLTLVPTKLYFKNGLVKVELGLARGKKLYDKRRDEIKKSTEKDIRRHLGV